MKRITSTRASGLVLTGVVGLAGLGVGAALAPFAASAATTTTQAATGRATAIKDALAGLVKNGTLSQDQADKVAATLDQAMPQRGVDGYDGPDGDGYDGPDGFAGPGGPGHAGVGHGGFGPGAGLDAAADLLKMTTDDLVTALQSGKTLAQIAQSKGVSQAALIDALVKAQKAELADAVKAGRLTQAQADAISANLKAMITAGVTSSWAGHGPSGRRGWDGPDGTVPSPGPTAPGTTAPSTTS